MQEEEIKADDTQIEEKATSSFASQEIRVPVSPSDPQGVGAVETVA